MILMPMIIIFTKINQAGWHCSWCFKPEGIRKKLLDAPRWFYILVLVIILILVMIIIPHPHPHRLHHQDAPHLWHGHLWHENHATDVRYCHFSGHLWHAHLWGWACHRCLKSDICELIMMLFWPDAMQSLQIMMPMMILMTMVTFSCLNLGCSTIHLWSQDPSVRHHLKDDQ